MELPIDYETSDWRARRVARQEYARLQKGLCWYCHAPLDEEPTQRVRRLVIDWSRFPPGFLDYPQHLHHSHDTGLTIGTVHALCNAVLWQYKGQ